MNVDGGLLGYAESSVDNVLEEIVDELGLLYISDVHTERNKELAMRYIEEQNICANNKKLYDDVMRYLKERR